MFYVKKIIFQILLSAAVLASLPMYAYGDRLVLNNGNTLEGVVTRKDGGYKVEFSSGHMVVEEEAVKEVVQSDTPLETFRKRHDRIKEEQPDAHYRLGRWAEQHGLEHQAEREYRHAIGLDPDHAQARRALGYKKYEGTWMTREEIMREKGYVKYDGEWVTPEVREAKQKLKEKRRLEKKKQRAEARRRKQELERSRRRISRLERRLRRVRTRSERDRRDDYTFYGTGSRSYPFFGGHFYGPSVILHGSKVHRRKKRHRRHNLHSRKKDGNTVRVRRFRNGELWKEIRSDGSKQVIHEPNDGHVVRRHIDRSKVVRKHHPSPNAPADKTLYRPRRYHGGHHRIKNGKHHGSKKLNHRPSGYQKPTSHHRGHIQK